MTREKTRLALFSGLFCLLLMLLISIFSSPSTPPENNQSTIATFSPVTAPDAERVQYIETISTLDIAIAKGSELGKPPASLEGTDVDATLSMDAQGNLVINLDLRSVFDYFLATSGEEDLSDIRARIALYLNQHLSPAATKQAWEILNAYLDYKLELDNKEEHDGSFAGMRDNLSMERELRVAILGPSLATAFYQPEIHQYREQQLGADAADRLADLDQQRNQWHQRYVEYRQQLTDIQHSGLSDTDTAAAIEQLRRQLFEARELKRVSVLDRLASERLR